MTANRSAEYANRLWDGENGPEQIAAALKKWERQWAMPGLTREITVSFSPRLRRTLGRAVPSKGRITLHLALRSASREQLLEVLCHEVAHIAAAHRAHRRGLPRPVAHGTEWAALVRSAGYTPTASAPLPPPPDPRPATTMSHPRIQSLRVVHSCPVCHTERVARRVVRAWRCAECVAAGLDGRMVITRRGVEEL